MHAGAGSLVSIEFVAHSTVVILLAVNTAGDHTLRPGGDDGAGEESQEDQGGAHHLQQWVLQRLPYFWMHLYSLILFYAFTFIFLSASYKNATTNYNFGFQVSLGLYFIKCTYIILVAAMVKYTFEGLDGGGLVHDLRHSLIW